MATFTVGEDTYASDIAGYTLADEGPNSSDGNSWRFQAPVDDYAFFLEHLTDPIDITTEFWQATGWIINSVLVAGGTRVEFYLSTSGTLDPVSA